MKGGRQRVALMEGLLDTTRRGLHRRSPVPSFLSRNNARASAVAGERLEHFAPGDHVGIDRHGTWSGLRAGDGAGPICYDLRVHAEKMMRAGATADEAERRYMVPKKFQDYEIYGGFTVGAAMRSYFTRLSGARSPEDLL
jgi:hypothetical protein